jgi:3-oxoadipate enol-lactonase/4-carboxymuconolactone decarboxylase
MTVELSWRIDGPPAAPPLVLLNSVGTTTEMWAPAMGPLAERFRVIRIDLRGHGASPAAPPGESHDLADLGRDVLGALDQLGIKRAAIAGLSLGGMTAMWLAIHFPQRVGRLVLLCTSAYLPPSRFWLDRAASARADGLAAIADSVVARWIAPSLAARDPELLRWLREMFVGVDAESYADCCEAIAGMDLRADLGRIAAPTLIVAGADDVATPPEHARLIAGEVAGARLAVLENAAHIVTVEQPGAVSRLLVEHFEAADPLAAGLATRRAVLGDQHVERAIAATTPFTRPFQDFLTRYAWGDVWARPGLSRRDRSIATLAALVTLGAEDELRLHVRSALRNGVTVDELAEVLLHTALYAGLPRANRAFALAREVLDADDV